MATALDRQPHPNMILNLLVTVIAYDRWADEKEECAEQGYFWYEGIPGFSNKCYSTCGYNQYRIDILGDDKQLKVCFLYTSDCKLKAYKVEGELKRCIEQCESTDYVVSDRNSSNYDYCYTDGCPLNHPYTDGTSKQC